MGEFFKGWRRKAGLVTLAMACALMGMWARSSTLCDVLSFRAFGDRHYLMSDHSRFLWGRERNSMVWGSVRHTVVRLADMRDSDEPFDGFLESRWRCKFAGLEFGFDEVDGGGFYGLPRNMHWCRTPYLSLVLPLTLLSAWLILAKPRKAKAATGSTP